MTNVEAFLQRVLDEKRVAHEISQATCDAFLALPACDRRPYASAMRFFGCESIEVPTDTSPVPEIHRIEAARVMLLPFLSNGPEPTWSSWFLDRFFEAVMATPGGSVGDVLRALFDLLSEPAKPLSETMMWFIMAIVRPNFVRYRDSVDTSEFIWLVRDQYATESQAYLAMLCIPPAIMKPMCAIAILRKLAPTPFWNEALNNLNEDLESEEGRNLLRELMAEEIGDSARADLRNLLGTSRQGNA